jgi:hypothetical protein
MTRRMLGNMTDAPAPVPTSSGPSVRRRWRDTAWGSVVLSYDFYCGVPAGIAIGVLPAFVKAAASMATTLLIAFGASLLGIAAVVVAALTIFVTVLSPEYLVALQRLPGGVKGAARPYVITGWVCIIGALCSFAAALGWPAIPGHSWELRWFVFSVSAAATGWGLLGTAQLVSLGSFHLNQRSELLKAVGEVRRRSQSRSA